MSRREPLLPIAVPPAPDRWRSLLDRFDLRSSAKWFVLSTVIGIVSGLGAVAFHFASETVMRFTLERCTGYEPRGPDGEHSFFRQTDRQLVPGMLVLVAAAGGLVSGAIVYTFAPEAEGHGTDSAIEAYHQKRGWIRSRIPIVKLVSSAITIGTGGSGGREGPIAQIGAGFGSFLATKLKLSPRDRRIMLAAGMGAGIGSIFRAPLAGALFAGEILYREADIESEVIVPAAVSSIVGFSVFSLFLPAELRFTPLFGNQLHYAPGSILELIPLTILAVVLVVVGIGYIKVFYGTQALFGRLPLPRHFRPAIGAALTALCGVATYLAFNGDEHALAVLGTGYGTLQAALERSSQLGAALLVAVALVKIVTTSLTIGSGGSGGVFGPSMVIGGCLGAAFGNLAHGWFPGLVREPQSYAIIGMAGFFAGCAHAPISTIIMVSELTGDYKLLLPTMWVSTLCFLLCRTHTLYVKQVPTRLDSPAHRGDFFVDVLEGIKVADVPLTSRQTVIESKSLRDILRLISQTQQDDFPVVDSGNRLVGIFSTGDVRAYLLDDALWQVANARDIMTTRISSVTPDDDLNTALQRFTELNLDELPVLAADDPGRLLGMLRRTDCIAVYNHRVLEQKQKVDDANRADEVSGS